jgi:mono/diheme cytochrome c family protein
MVVLTAVALVAAGPACQKRSQTAPVTANAVEHGRYLVTIMDCNACHTPLAMGPHGPAPDMSRMLSGHPQSLIMPPPPELPPGPWGWTGAATNTAFAGPWGVTFATNLTPDPNTGLGIWTEEMFVGAMRTGRHMGTSRQIQAPMPWQAYAQLTDNDLEAIYTYLRSVPPIFNRVPDWQPPKGQ